MGNRLFIGNLPFDTREEDLAKVIEGAGHKATSVKVVTDRDTGRSRGFAFADFESDEAAASAISALNGKDFGGRPLRVNVAEEKGAGGKFGGGGGGGFRGGQQGFDKDQRGGFGSRGPTHTMPRGSQRGGGRGGGRGE